jgi:hypothetical protein
VLPPNAVHDYTIRPFRSHGAAPLPIGNAFAGLPAGGLRQSRGSCEGDTRRYVPNLSVSKCLSPSRAVKMSKAAQQSAVIGARSSGPSQVTGQEVASAL